MNWIFTSIQHGPRKKLGISCNEYTVLDLIFRSQTHPDFSHEGWAKTGIHQIAEALDLSPGTVKGIFDRTEKMSLLEFRDTKKIFKKTTPAFYNVAYLEDRSENEQQVFRNRTEGVQKMNSKCSETEPVYNNSNKEVSKYKERGVKAIAFTPPQRDEVLTVYAQIFTDSKVKNARAWADWEATKFFDHYTANGWKVGGKGRLTPMKSWQQAATRWAKKCIEDGISDKRLPDKYAATSAVPADFPKQRTLVF